MIELIRANQLEIMLFFSGVCAVLIPLTWATTILSSRRKWLLTLIEVVSTLLLIFDRFAYIFRGDVSTLGYWMVRISNFMTFALQLFQLLFFNLYLCDMLLKEGKAEKPPKLLVFNQLLQLLYIVNKIHYTKLLSEELLAHFGHDSGDVD